MKNITEFLIKKHTKNNKNYSINVDILNKIIKGDVEFNDLIFAIYNKTDKDNLKRITQLIDDNKDQIVSDFNEYITPILNEISNQNISLKGLYLYLFHSFGNNYGFALGHDEEDRSMVSTSKIKDKWQIFCGNGDYINLTKDNIDKAIDFLEFTTLIKR